MDFGDLSNVAIDPALADRVSDLYRQVDQVMDEKRISAREREEVQKNLMEATAAELLTRLGGKLSESERAEMGALSGTDQEPDLNAVADYFRTKFPQETLVEELAHATESVLTDFIAEMEK